MVALIATTPVVEDLLSEVTCGSVAVQTLVARGTDAHTFELTPKLVKAIHGAAAIVSVGGGIEPWLKPGMVRGSAKSLELAAVMPFRKGQLGVDPHFWHSPVYVRLAAQKVAAFVAELPGADRIKISECEKNFEKRIAELESVVWATLAPIAASRRVIAVTHESFGYFGEAFGFRVVSLMGSSTEAAPTPNALRGLVKTIQEQKIGAVFVETGTQRKLMETVAREAKVKIGGELVADALGEKSSPAGSVLGMWKTNARVIAEALK